MRDTDLIRADVAARQRGAKAGRLAVLASMLLGFAFVAPQALIGQIRAQHHHETMTTRQAFQYVGKSYAGPALEEWAAKADNDDLETTLDAAQILDAAGLAVYLADKFSVSVAADIAPRLVEELRYYERFLIMPLRPLRTPVFPDPRGSDSALGQLERMINRHQLFIH